jgi:hypothetical protein
MMAGYWAPVLNSYSGPHCPSELDFCVPGTRCSLAILCKLDSISTPLIMETCGLVAKHGAILETKKYRVEDPSPHLHLPLAPIITLSQQVCLHPSLVAPVTQSAKPAKPLTTCLVSLLVVLGRRQGQRETNGHAVSQTRTHNHQPQCPLSS